MFELREDLNPALVGLAWLIGHWEGEGKRQLPGLEPEEFGVSVDFAENGGDYLHYLAQYFTRDGEGRPQAPLTMETGFWRAFPDATVEALLTSPEGYLDLWAGKLQGGRIDLVTDTVIRSVSAPEPYTGGRRLYGNVEGKLMFAFDRATEDHPMSDYLWATLERA
ncbi:MAG: FABP family protein [Propionibacteriaceae bacterium]|jgi:hypothetical protein|nr:FABP family protein [Propionibacteriaceae bacterium]